jgi:hypothetical protein
MRQIISLGNWSSASATIIAVAYGILQILFSLHLIPHPGNLDWFLVPFFLFASVFLITIICFDLLTPAKSRKWTTIAWVLGTANCTMITMVYFSQLAHINPSLFNWQREDLRLPLFEHHTDLQAVKYTWYFLVSASTFISAFAFRNLNAKRLYRSLLISGILLPIFIFSWFYPKYSFLNYVWIATFSLATLHARRFFNKEKKKLEKKEKRMSPSVEWAIH